MVVIVGNLIDVARLINVSQPPARLNPLRIKRVEIKPVNSL